MLGALFERDIRPDLIVGTSVGALHGAARRRRPDAGLRREARGGCGSELPELGVLGSVVRPTRVSLVRLAHARPLERAAAAARRSACSASRRSRSSRCRSSASPRRIERAAEHWFSERPARRRDPRLRVGAGAAAARRDRRRALHRRRDREQHPDRPRGRARRRRDLRAPRRPDRPAARGAEAACGTSPSSASRSPGATDSSASWPPSPRASPCTCSRPASPSRRAGTSSPRSSPATSTTLDRRIASAREATGAYLDAR